MYKAETLLHTPGHIYKTGPGAAASGPVVIIAS
jgi:hypothetical protein